MKDFWLNATISAIVDVQGCGEEESCGYLKEGQNRAPADWMDLRIAATYIEIKMLVSNLGSTLLNCGY